MTGRTARASTPAEQGFALLIVLWALIPLSLLFLVLTASTRSDAQSTANLRRAAQLEAAADGGIYTAIFGLLQRGGAGLAPLTTQLAGSTVSVEVSGLSGLVNPNTASPDLLQALLVRLGTDTADAVALAGAVVDWRTPGQRPSPHGAKAAAYREAGLGYGPPGAPFESLDELGSVLGMTPALLQALRPSLNLYSDADPDPRAAGPLVRAALRDVGVDHASGPPNNQVVQITATAAGAGGIRSARRAIIRIGPTSNGRTWRTLAWDTWFDR